MTFNRELRRQVRRTGDDISVFLMVCEVGSFAAASATLGLTPSAVAKAIARLEGRVGVRLFHRTTRRLTLTAEAVIYRKACDAARGEIDRVEAELASFSAEPSGTVRLSLPPLLGTRVIAPLLYDLCRQWPQLRLEIATSTALSDLPGEGVDVAVRVGQLPDLPGLGSRNLGMQKVTLCAAPGYLANRPTPHDVTDLSGHALIAAAKNGRCAPWHFDLSGGERLTYQPQARLLLDGSSLTLSAIRAGQGLGVLPAWLVADDITSGDLVAVLEDQIAGHMPVHALWVTSREMLPRVRVTLDAIVRATGGVLRKPV
jgi:DNA-binding transcriptional LysR family regulator